MPEEHLEGQTYRYRKSPGRQYGYDYDPLRSQHDSTPGRSGALLSQRPDPRRTRQLLRQSIIESKRTDGEESADGMEYQAGLQEISPSASRPRTTRRIHHPPSESGRPSVSRVRHVHHVRFDDEHSTLIQRTRTNGGHVDDVLSDRQMLMPPREASRGSWSRQQQERYVDPDIGVDEDAELDPLERQNYDYVPSERAGVVSKNIDKSQSGQRLTRRLPETPLEHDEDHVYNDDEALPPGLRVVKKPKSSSRRKFLIGAGIVAAGGAGVGFALSQAASQSPIQKALQNTEDQIKQAFNQGVAQGANDARKALLSELDSIQSFTLQGAVDAARLTRVAYDVFVSPIIKFGSTLSGDFLGAMLNSFITARKWLAGINQDTVTLAAIQKVLESWVAQVQNLPKQLDAIAQTDLDGAQAYLHALQQKIEAEKQALDHPTPTAQPTPSPTPKK